MKIYDYKDYDDYVRAQTYYNKDKVGRFVFVRRGAIGEIKAMFPHAQSVLCHGTRSGEEQQFFKEFYPKAEVVGTEISDNATSFPLTVCWDFAKPKAEWAGKFDIVYSNSLDHALHPVETIETWRDQLSNQGKMVIEWSKRKEGGGVESDPFAASTEEIENLCRDAGMDVRSVKSRRAKEQGIFVIGSKK
jgi:hypothetical protein